MKEEMMGSTRKSSKRKLTPRKKLSVTKRSPRLHAKGQSQNDTSCEGYPKKRKQTVAFSRTTKVLKWSERDGEIRYSCNISKTKFHSTRNTKVLKTTVTKATSKIHVTKSCARSEQGKTFKCKRCPRKFRHKGSLQAHIVTRHDEDNLKYCDLCLTSFRTVYLWKAHMKDHSKTQGALCQKCGKLFTLEKDLRRHLVTHTSTTPYECVKCGFVNRRKDNLKRHLLQKHFVSECVASNMVNEAALVYLKSVGENIRGLSSKRLSSRIISNVIMKDAAVLTEGQIIQLEKKKMLSPKKLGGQEELPVVVDAPPVDVSPVFTADMEVTIIDASSSSSRKYQEISSGSSNLTKEIEPKCLKRIDKILQTSKDPQRTDNNIVKPSQRQLTEETNEQSRAVKPLEDYWLKDLSVTEDFSDIGICMLNMDINEEEDEEFLELNEDPELNRLALLDAHNSEAGRIFGAERWIFS